jgi:uncharacterized protein YuzE
MEERYLEATFRDGKALAAYLYLPRTPGMKVARTEEFDQGILVDYDSNGAPMGVEITAPGFTSVEEINRVLDRLNQPRLGPEELAPLAAA